jgi:hypothetical protein
MTKDNKHVISIQDPEFKTRYNRFFCDSFEGVYKRKAALLTSFGKEWKFLHEKIHTHFQTMYQTGRVNEVLKLLEKASPTEEI